MAGSFAQLYTNVGMPYLFVETGVPIYSGQPLTVDVWAIHISRNENMIRENMAIA